MLIVMMFVILIFIPLVAGYEKRQKAEWRERRRKMREIGAEYDDDEEFNRERSEKSSEPSSPRRGAEDENPYRPPCEGP